MDLKSVTPEQREKARNCKSPEELLNLAKNEGYELTDEELQAVSGGNWFTDPCSEATTCGKDGCDIYFDA